LNFENLKAQWAELPDWQKILFVSVVTFAIAYMIYFLFIGDQILRKNNLEREVNGLQREVERLKMASKPEIKKLAPVLMKAFAGVNPDKIIHIELKSKGGITYGDIFSFKKYLNWRFDSIHGETFFQRNDVREWNVFAWKMIPQEGQLYFKSGAEKGKRIRKNWIVANLQLPVPEQTRLQLPDGKTMGGGVQALAAHIHRHQQRSQSQPPHLVHDRRPLHRLLRSETQPRRALSHSGKYIPAPFLHLQRARGTGGGTGLGCWRPRRRPRRTCIFPGPPSATVNRPRPWAGWQPPGSGPPPWAARRYYRSGHG